MPTQFAAGGRDSVATMPSANLSGQVDNLRPIVPVRAPRTLVAEVTANLRRVIHERALAGDLELPTEPGLAQQLGVSRGTLRQAIAILEQDGLISRRQGLGTFVVPHTGRLRNVLNTNFGITDLIRETGGQPVTSRFEVSVRGAEDGLAEKLEIPVGDPVAVIERIRCADKLPVAYTTDYLPVSHLQSRNVPVERLEEMVRSRGSLYACLRELALVVDGGAADLRAVNADQRLATMLQVKIGDPLLYLSQTDYGDKGVVILYSDEYLPSYLAVQVWRKGPG